MIIGISGKRGSGKDTAADLINYLAVPTGKYFKVLKFADKLKQTAALLLGLPPELMYTQAGKTQFLPDYNMTVGEFQQKLGTEAIRDGLHVNTWVFALFADMKPGGNYIVTDVRFENEAAEIKKRGGLMLRIEGNPAGMQGDGTRNDLHASETALDNYAGFDAVILNNGTLFELSEKLKGFLLQTQTL